MTVLSTKSLLVATTLLTNLYSSTRVVATDLLASAVMHGHQSVIAPVDATSLCVGKSKPCLLCFSWFLTLGGRYSILPALSLDGILALDIQDHPFTAEDLNDFVDRFLTFMNPFPLPKSVLVMDNASAHHSDDLREIIEEQYIICS
jgi:hypothetical protein